MKTKSEIIDRMIELHSNCKRISLAINSLELEMLEADYEIAVLQVELTSISKEKDD